MSTRVDDLIKLLNIQENKYGGATGRPRELNVSFNGNFCRSIESEKLDVEIPKMGKYYEQKIRNKAIKDFMDEAMKQLTEFDLTHFLPTVADCKNILREVAEQMKEVE